MADQMVQYAAMTPDLKRAGVVEIFAAGSPVIDELFFIDLGDAMGWEYNVEAALSGIAFRGLNEQYSAETGVINPVKEGTAVMGGLVNIDRRMAKKQSYRASQIAMKVKAAAGFFTKNFFDGDTGSNPKAFDGLNKRLTGANVKWAGTNGGTFDNDVLSALIDRVPGEAGQKRLLMGAAMRRRIGAVLRAKGQTVIQLAEWEGELKPKTYDGVPIRIVGEDEGGSEILDFDETRGSSHVTASIYCARFGQSLDGEYLQAIANHAAAGVFEVDEQGVRGTTDQVLVEAQLGLVVHHPKCVTRYGGITDANPAA